jgi:hypothetical protein
MTVYFGTSDSTVHSLDALVVSDTTRPSVTVNKSAGQADPSDTSPITFAIVFSEPVTGFTSSDATLSGTAGATNKVLTGSEATYTLTVSGMVTAGTVVVSVPANVAQDAAGNLNFASTSTDNSVSWAPPTPAPVDPGPVPASPTALSMRVFSRTNPNGPAVALLENSSDRRWSDQRSDLGGGSFTIPLSSGDVAACAYGNVVRCYIDGMARSAWRIMERRRVVGKEAKEQVLEVSGPGLTDLLTEAVVYPEFAQVESDERRFDVTSLAFDDSSWVAPTINTGHALPEGWNDLGARWFWDRNLAPGALYPPGDVYFRRDLFLVLDEATPSNFFTLWVSADGGVEVWIEGNLVISELTR